MTKFDKQTIKVGNIYLGQIGYSMIIYKFYRVKKVTDKTVTFEELEKTTISYSDPGYNQNPIVSLAMDKDGNPIKLNKKSFYKRIPEKGIVSTNYLYGFIDLCCPLTEDQIKRGFAEDHQD